MRTLPSLIAVAALIAMFGPGGQAQAASFCATSAAEIQTALNTAAANDENDIIFVVAGTYDLSSGLSFVSSKAYSITILGGYNAGCFVATHEDTILDGQNTLRPLYISSSNGSVRVEGFTFSGGLSTNNRGGGLSISSGSGGVRVDLNRFIGNHADDFAGGLEISASNGDIYLRGNLFFGNTGASTGAAELFIVNGAGYVVGNTVVANSSADDTAAGGLELSGGVTYTLSDNIVWNNTDNGAPDVRAFNSLIDLFNNDVGTATGNTGTVSGEQSVDPQFATCQGLLCFTFELARSSPLVDAGEDAPLGGTTVLDLDGKPRKIGAHVDIGAYEQDVIFNDGFE